MLINVKSVIVENNQYLYSQTLKFYYFLNRTYELDFPSTWDSCKEE